MWTILVMANKPKPKTITIKGQSGVSLIEHTFKVWRSPETNGWNWMPIDDEFAEDYEEETVVQLQSGIMQLFWIDYPEREIVQDLIIDLIVEDSDIWFRELAVEYGFKTHMGVITVKNPPSENNDIQKVLHHLRRKGSG